MLQLTRCNGVVVEEEIPHWVSFVAGTSRQVISGERFNATNVVVVSLKPFGAGEKCCHGAWGSREDHGFGFGIWRVDDFAARAVAARTAAVFAWAAFAAVTDAVTGCPATRLVLGEVAESAGSRTS